jgi:hypothetical protein
MPVDPCRRDDIVAAVAAYDRDHPDAPLPRNAGRLLAVMFPSEDVCKRSQEAVVADGFSRNGLSATLRHLLEAGFVSKQRGSACIPDTYRLHLLPALVRP